MQTKVITTLIVLVVIAGVGYFLLVSPDDENGNGASGLSINGEENVQGIVAKLDREAARTGCHPFYPIDLFVLYDNGEEMQVYDDISVCDPGGTPFEDGPVADSGLLSSSPVEIGGKRIGTIVSNQSGDAGHSWKRDIFISHSEPENTVSAEIQKAQGGSFGMTLSNKSVMHVITIEPAPFTFGKCRDQVISILFDGTPVWKFEGDTTRFVCKDEIVIRGGVEKTRTVYNSDLLDLRPTDETFTKFLFQWNSLGFRFDLQDPINTFLLRGKG